MSSHGALTPDWPNDGTAPRALPVHATDYPWAFQNPENVITVRVRGHLSEDGYGIGGRLVSAIDENGNVYPLVGLTPGSVMPCPACGRKVYLPDRAATEGRKTLICPFLDCRTAIPTSPAFGAERMEDEPAVWSGGACREHGEACPRERQP